MLGLGRIKQTDNEVYFNVRHAERLKANGQFA